MALVTVQRSTSNSSQSTLQTSAGGTDEADGSEGQEEDEGDIGCYKPQQRNRSFSECYFAVKGAALVLPHDECMHVYRRSSTNAGDIQLHLQSMFYLLRPEDTLKMAVKLESVHARRTRYLVVVSCQGRQNTEESCLLGIDCNNNTTIGLVLPVWADTRITLDGDGGFSVSANGRHHIFKPVSVQAMWSALQTLHKASAKAREYTYFPGGGTHHWVEYYEERITSDRSCLNEWYAMDDLVSRRPPSPDTDRTKPTEVEETQQLIRCKLKELMMSVDLDDVTSKEIRTRLEEEMDMNLNDYKSFIDQEMLVILGQMDAPTEIFEYLYLGSEWNASNLDELKIKGVGHILNVTREIDNFFPGMFDYLNVRVYDDESTEMLQYWDKTYKYIRKAKDKGSKVLVHCKMGISRSASVVIAYVMKAYDWDLERALKFVRNKRNCIKPNENFLKQLEIYQGILDASKHRHNSLWRSKSETNLKSPDKPKKSQKKDSSNSPNDNSENKENEPNTPYKKCYDTNLLTPGTISRPKSWSPDDATANLVFTTQPLMNGVPDSTPKRPMNRQRYGTDPSHYQILQAKAQNSCKEEESCNKEGETEIGSGMTRVSSVKDRISELESQAQSVVEVPKASKMEAPKPTDLPNKAGLVLNLATQFESVSKPSTPSPVEEGITITTTAAISSKQGSEIKGVVSHTKPPAPKHQAVLIKSDQDAENGGASPEGQVQASDGTELGHPATSKKDESRLMLLKKQLCLTSSKSPPAEKKSASTNLVRLPSQTTASQQSPSLPASSASTCDSVFLWSRQSSCSSSCGTESPPPQPSLQVRKAVARENAEVLASTLGSHCFNDSSSSSSSPLRDTPCKSMKPGCCEAEECIQLEDSKEFLYEKEAIPWTPGTVLRTKQQIEEQNLRQQASSWFDTAFPSQSRSTPSTPPEVMPDADGLVLKTPMIQRSHSFRSEKGSGRRPASSSVVPLGSKWYPLPALASPSVFGGGPLFRGSQRTATSTPSLKDQTGSVRVPSHSISTPSVVEAVNQVLCGTREVLNSAIRSSSAGQYSPPPVHRNAFEFGEHVDVYLPMTEAPSSKSVSVPVPGTVKQQKEALESLNTKSLAHGGTEEESRIPRDQMRMIKEYGRCLVGAEDPLEGQDGGDTHGVVKRLTKELEAKTGNAAGKRDRVIIIDKDGKELMDDPSSNRDSAPSSPSSRPRSPFVLPEPSTLEKERTHKSRTFSDSQVESRPSSIVDRHPPTTPQRKASLDVECLSRKVSAGALSSSHLLCNRTPSSSSSLPSAKPPPASSFVNKSASSTTMPPPPAGSLPRKVRKVQQGKSHPLSKLTAKHRHSNPLYNTM